jgi:eukaryotic-like serine/threonine-protein kinase
MDSRGTSRTDSLLNGRYRLLRPLGSGGMGTVWQATDELLGRPVAIKELFVQPGLAATQQEVLRRRTMREAQAAARLRHPSVVTVYDVVEQAGRPWIVMEFVPSRSLADVVRDEGPLAVPDAAAIGLAVLGALTTAHQAGVLHRDVKPGNVLLADDGRVVLTDFGIARFAGDSTLTTGGLLVGSPSYISPERARGEHQGPASDLWSLGACLYSAVEGVPPFHRDSPLATLTAVLTEPVPVPQRAGPLWPVIYGLLVKDPALRLTARPARMMLERVLADSGRGEPPAYPIRRPAPATRAEPPSRPPPRQRRRRFRPPWRSGAAAAAAAAPAASGAAAAERTEAGPARPAAAAAPTEAEPTAPIAAAAPEAEWPTPVTPDTAAAPTEAEPAAQAAAARTEPEPPTPAAPATPGAAAGRTEADRAAPVAAARTEPEPPTPAAPANAAGPTEAQPAGPTAAGPTEAERPTPVAAAASDAEPPAPAAAASDTDDAPAEAARTAPAAAATGGTTADRTEAGAAAPVAAARTEPEPTAPAAPAAVGTAGTTEAEPPTSAAPAAPAALGTAAATEAGSPAPAASAVPGTVAARTEAASREAGPPTPAAPAARGPTRGRPSEADAAEPAGAGTTGAAAAAAAHVSRTRPIGGARGTVEPARPGGSLRRRVWAAIAVGVAAAVAALLVFVPRHGGSGRAAPPAQSASTAPTVAASQPAPHSAAPPAGGGRAQTGGPARTAGPARTGGQANPANRAGGGAASIVVPPGFVFYHDVTGFSIVVPAGWRRVRNGTLLDFREPGGLRFLRVDQTDSPKGDPVLDWQNQSQYFAQTHTGYQLVRPIVRVDYRGWDAADWEFTWTSGDLTIHVLNRNIVPRPTKAYALYWSTPDSVWNSSRYIFDVAARTFQPAPP